MKAIVDGKLVEVDRDLAGDDIVAPREIVTSGFSVRAERSYTTLRADLFDLEVQRLSAPTTKPCTCEGGGGFTGRPCSGAARLGDLWHCVKTGERGHAGRDAL